MTSTIPNRDIFNTPPGESTNVTTRPTTASAEFTTASEFAKVIDESTMSTTDTKVAARNSATNAAESTTIAVEIHKEDKQIRVASSKQESSYLLNTSVCDTFSQLKDVCAVLVPWRVFHKRPDCLHSAFRYDHGHVVYNNEVNVFMEAAMLNPSQLGHLDDFTQTWEVKVTTEEELDVLLIRLASFPTLLSATLTKRKLLGDNSEIPTVLFVDPNSDCMQQLARNLGNCRKTFREGKYFSVEVDLGPSVEIWSKMVLRRDFLCIGARFCVTSGSKFNHMWDWSNILGCLPCWMCGCVAAAAYRANRKLKYIDMSGSELENIATVGAQDQNASSQRVAVYSLMKWIHSVPSPVCNDCKLLLSKPSTNIGCSECHVQFQELQRSHSTLHSQGSDITENEQFDINQKGDTENTLAGNITAYDSDVISDIKEKQTTEFRGNEPNFKHKETPFFPYYEEPDKIGRKDGNKHIFIKNKKKLPNINTEYHFKKNVLIHSLVNSPYNSKATSKSIKKPDTEQVQTSDISRKEDEVEIKARTSFGRKNLKDALSYGANGVSPLTSRTDDGSSKNNEAFDPIGCVQAENDISNEFSIDHRSTDSHAFVLPESPSEAYFDEFDPQTHGDVLNFLACKTANKATPQSKKTKKSNKTQKKSTRKKRVQKRQTHA